MLPLYLDTVANLTICLFFFIICNTFSYIIPIHIHSHIAVSIATIICYMVFLNIQTLNMTVINEVVTAPSSNWQGSNSMHILYVACFIVQYIVLLFCGWLFSSSREKRLPDPPLFFFVTYLNRYDVIDI